MIWRDGDSRRAHVGGTGSISCRGLTEEQAAEADTRRGPIGFALPHPAYGPQGSPRLRLEDFTMNAVSAVTSMRMKATEALLRDLGECLWTARDIVVVYVHPDGSETVST